MKQTQEQIKQEVSNIQALLASRNNGFKTRTAHAVAKALLLHGWYLYNGLGLTPYAKSVGCGVYEVWVEEK